MLRGRQRKDISMKRFGFILWAGLLVGAGAKEQAWEVKAPDGRITAEVRLDAQGKLDYHVTFCGQNVLNTSPLGLVRADQPFTAGLTFDALRRDKISEDYTMPHGKRSHCHAEANELTLAFRGTQGGFLQVIFRAYNDGVAFRYRFPETDPAAKTVTQELTGFQLLPLTKVWRQPYDEATMYAPGYERLFDNGVAADTTSTNKVGWCFPLLSEAHADGPWVLLTEALLDGSYCACRLESDAPQGLYRLRFPEANEGNGTGQVAPSHALPWATPWRVAIIGATPGTIVESTLVDDLNPPPAAPVPDWVKPGRVAWSWWSEPSSPRQPERMKPFIDLAADMGWEYFLVDANWNFIPEPEFLALLDYAKQKGVGILLWYNSGGPHNSVTEAPRDRMMPRDVRRQEFAKLQRLGVKGVKVDFFQSDKQNIIEHYLDILRDAADFGIMVNFHGCTMQRGWARTFPHLMTMEGVRGAESYIFDPHFAAAAPGHNTILAFTRNVCGSMDYTPVTFADNKNPHVTTWGHELALSVVFESGWFHFADGVASYRAAPDCVKDFLRHVPVVWDEVKYLAGMPGDSVVLARRHGAEWYLGGINGTAQPKTITVALDFLTKGTFMLNRIGDGAGPRAFAQAAPAQAVRGDQLTVELLPFGGFVARLQPR
jgi:hypothetical protein